MYVNVCECYECIRVYSSVFECMLVMYSRSVLSGSVSTLSSNVWKSILSLWEWAQERDFHSSSSLCWWQSFSRTCSLNTLKYTHNIHMQSNSIKYTHHTHKHSNTLLTLNTLKTFTYTHIHRNTLFLNVMSVFECICMYVSVFECIWLNLIACECYECIWVYLSCRF